MKRTLAALGLALIASGPALADVSGSFLPDLTFPAPITKPEISTQGCALPFLKE